jgi:hypothetical protein
MKSGTRAFVVLCLILFVASQTVFSQNRTEDEDDAYPHIEISALDIFFPSAWLEVQSLGDSWIYDEDAGGMAITLENEGEKFYFAITYGSPGGDKFLIDEAWEDDDMLYFVMHTPGRSDSYTIGCQLEDDPGLAIWHLPEGMGEIPFVHDDYIGSYQGEIDDEDEAHAHMDIGPIDIFFPSTWLEVGSRDGSWIYDEEAGGMEITLSKEEGEFYFVITYGSPGGDRFLIDEAWEGENIIEFVMHTPGRDDSYSIICQLEDDPGVAIWHLPEGMGEIPFVYADYVSYYSDGYEEMEDPYMETEDPYEDDNAMEMANSLTGSESFLTSSETHTIYPENDEDWFEFYATAGQRPNIRTKSSNDDTDVDTVITIFDRSMNELAENDDSDDGSFSALSSTDWNSSYSGFYYCRVTGYGGETGTYLIEINF